MHYSRMLLQMIAKLHEMGYESIRLCPTISNSGVHWVSWITSADCILPNHGAVIHPTAMVQALRSSPIDTVAACYTSAQNGKYFGWDDAAQDSPIQLASKFVTRFPMISVHGKNSDKPYVLWYQNMIRHTEPEGVPSTYSASPETTTLERSRLVVLGNSQRDSISLPPAVAGSRERS